MRKGTKNVFTRLICLIMLIGLNISTLHIEAGAANSYVINGVTVKYTDVSDVYDGSHNCWRYAQRMYGKIWGSTSDFNNDRTASNNLIHNVTSKTDLTLTAAHLKDYVTQAVPGAVIRTTNESCLFKSGTGGDNVGHSQIIVQIDSNGFTVFEGNIGSGSERRREYYYTWNEYVTKWRNNNHAYIKYIKWPGTHEFNPSVPTVSPMTTGAGRTIPDGNYIIGNSADTRFYLDIDGSTVPAEGMTNVHIAENEHPPEYDIWTVQYIDNGGFYTIKQLNGEAYLDVISPETGDGANVQVWNAVEYNDEIWSISRAGNGIIWLQSKANGLYATVDGDLTGGTNVSVKYPTGDSRQEWFFIPWPKTTPTGAGQTIPDGNYMISLAANPRYYLDIDGTDVPAEAFTNVKLWYNEEDGDVDAPDVWTVNYVDEGGFYTIKQLNGDAYLDVLSPSNAQCQTVQIWDNPNSDYDEKWSIVPIGGSYRIQSKASGLYATVDGNIEIGSNIIVQSANSGNGQNWIFTPWPSAYTVSYNANGGTGAPGNQTKINGQTLTLSNTKPTRANSSAGSYKVTLNANGGSVSPASLDAARTTSYTFKNWNTEANGSGTSYNPGASYTANSAATLYAQWNSSTTTAAVTLPTPTRDGYVFKGWATSSSATSGTTGNYTPSGNVTLYAIWTPKTYTVAYNANGGTGAPGNQTKYHDSALTLSSVKPTRANSSAGSYKVTLNANGGSVSPASLDAARTTSYTFKNWNTEANGSGTSYNPGASYTANSAATLYAQWESSTTTASVTLPAPTRNGYAFKGWATSSSATSGSTGSYKPTGNITLYAVWQKLQPDFTLPSNLREIGEEAFSGGAFTYVHVSDNVTKIGPRAFADCPNLRNIDIPSGTTGIDPTAFSGVSNLTIHGTEGSYAEFYAQKFGFVFVTD